MTSWREMYGGSSQTFEEVMSVEMTTEEALQQGLLDQIPNHVGKCSDDNRRTYNSKIRDMDLVNFDRYANCPRCFLLDAQEPDAHVLAKTSKLKLRVVVQIKKRSYLDDMRWGD